MNLKNKVDVIKDFGDVPEIHCSPSQVNQVFLNLITNAADAIEESGEIRVSTWAEDNAVKIRIADTGVGIPADLLEKIRDPFFTTKEVGQGTGLGMSIVDRIVDSHAGSLDIESEVGKGTTMTVTLPVQAVSSVDADADSEGLDREISQLSTHTDGAESVDDDEQPAPEAVTA